MCSVLTGLSNREINRSWYGRFLARIQTQTRSQKGHHPLVSLYKVKTGFCCCSSSAESESEASWSWFSIISQIEATSLSFPFPSTFPSTVAVLVLAEESTVLFVSLLLFLFASIFLAAVFVFLNHPPPLPTLCTPWLWLSENPFTFYALDRLCRCDVLWCGRS